MPINIEDPIQIHFGMTSFDFDQEKKMFVNSMDFLRSLNVEEFTFYKKWEEINKIYDDNVMVSNARPSKASIWVPTDINDEEGTIKEIENLQPVIKIVNGSALEELWLHLRVFCHSAEYSQAPGRFIKILIMDQNEKVLGFCAVASDLISIKARDEYIGWTYENRIEQKMLRYSAVGTTIAPTQPFGYNFLGGKLAAAVVTSDVVRKEWENKANKGEAVGCRLVGLTTTSLYGPFSMYNSHRWWHKCGKSTGRVAIKPDERFYKTWHTYIKEKKAQEYKNKMTQKEGVAGPVTSAKLRVLYMIYDEVGIKESNYQHGYERGVYYSCFYENAREFLCGKIKEEELLMKPLFQKNIDGILEWWKPKAIERYKRLKAENRLNGEKLFYSGMKAMTYKQAKEKYFSDLNRGKPEKQQHPLLV